MGNMQYDQMLQNNYKVGLVVRYIQLLSLSVMYCTLPEILPGCNKLLLVPSTPQNEKAVHLNCDDKCRSFLTEAV